MFCCHYRKNNFYRKKYATDENKSNISFKRSINNIKKTERKHPILFFYINKLTKPPPMIET